jgi:hypothetical protein
MISTRVHGIIDYLMAAVLIVVPFAFGFGVGNSAALWVPVVIGIVLLMTSLITRYELSVVKIVPMAVHLGADILAGLVLILSPFWLFGFSDQIWVPHVVLGVAEIGVPLLTRKHSKFDQGFEHRA